MNTSILRGLGLLTLVLSLACGDDSTPPTMDAAVATDSGVMGSGVDRSKRVPDLSTAEVSQLCSWGVAAAGGPGVTATCPEGDATTQTVAECEASVGAVPGGCTATVGEIEDCMQAMGADACALYSAPACQALIACATAAP